MQCQLFLPTTLQRPGPGLGQAGARLRVAEPLIDGLRLVQAAPGGVPFFLRIEGHGLIAEHDGAIVRRQIRGRQQVVEQLARLDGAIHVDIEPRHVGPDDGLAVGLVQLHHLLQRIPVIAFGLLIEAEVGIEVA
ncbi:hypothetical protein D3C72_1301880 [compost metagenome]